MPEKGTIIPLPASAQRLEEAAKLEKASVVSSVASGTWEASQKATPVGVAGDQGSSYTVFEANWRCEECETENVASKPRCRQCRARKPTKPQVASVDPPEAGEWKEVFDPSARHLYYFNAGTGETQWERPAAMGPTPHGSGWFGRGAAGSTAAAGYEKNDGAYVQRPARKQVEYIASKSTVLEGAYEYNIYWGKFIGDHWGDKGASRDKAETRCVVATDAGLTKADKLTRAQSSFCLFFARGCCALGPECRYYHRIPVRRDLEKLAKDEARDVFGRERHKEFRDDMTGVGALLQPCRTLYVGNLVKSEYADPAALDEALWRNFGEWGEVENINLVSRLSIAFVRYRYRSSAEFAKEAMANNHLDHDENLDLRWAHEDPNPVAHDANARADADALVEMLRGQGKTVDGSADFDHPDDYVVPDAKRLKSGDYPDTDRQYEDDWQAVVEPSSGDTYWWNSRTNETKREAPAAVADANAERAMAVLDAADNVAARQTLQNAEASSPAAAPVAVAVVHVREQQEEADETSGALPAGWAQTVDPASGATYYYHAATSQTTWIRPGES